MPNLNSKLRSYLFLWVAQALVLAVSVSSSQSLAADEDKASGSDETAPPVKPSKKEATLHDYSHELMGVVDYSNSKGTAKAEAATEETATASSEMGGSFTYGYLVGDHAEPILEVSLHQTTQTIATYESKSRTLEWGAGMLFNVPVGRTYLKNSKAARELNAPMFSNATFIPFGGLLITSRTATASEGSGGSPTSTTDGELATKVVIGFRVVPTAHLSINFSGRAFHQKSQAQAGSGDAVGGTASKTTFEVHLFGVSLLL